MARDTCVRLVDAVALDDAFLPLAHVAVALGRCPQSHPMFLACRPLPGVELPVGPPELAFALLLIVSEAAAVGPQLSELIPPQFAAVGPIAFEDVVLPQQNAHSLPFAVLDFPEE